MSVKQVIIVRTRYPHKDGSTRSLRTGKLIASACHASLGAYEQARPQAAFVEGMSEEGLREYRQLQENMQAWYKDDRTTKICLQVETEEQLRELFRRAKEKALPCHLVVDRGLTEFDGVPTVTALGIGPAPSETIDELTRELKLF